LLGNGIPTVYNAACTRIDSIFTMKAFIVSVGADMIGRSKVVYISNFRQMRSVTNICGLELMKTLGNRATMYCEYCLAKGIWNGAIYCPCTPPNDAPNQEKSRSGSDFPWTEYQLDRQSLPLRDNDLSRKIATHIVGDLCLESPKNFGIRGESILLQLQSIDFPRSFPPDIMPLFYENIIPSMFRHYRGVFFRSKAKAQVSRRQKRHSTIIDSTSAPSGMETSNIPSAKSHSNSESESSEDEHIPTNKPTAISRRSNRPPLHRKQQPIANLAKFVLTDDPWNISPAQWDTFGHALCASAKNFPASFGDPLRNFATHCHQLKAAEWAIVAKQVSPIFLRTLLPAQDYEAFVTLVDAIILLEQQSYSPNDLSMISCWNIGIDRDEDSELID